MSKTPSTIYFQKMNKEKLTEHIRELISSGIDRTELATASVAYFRAMKSCGYTDKELRYAWTEAMKKTSV